MFFYRLFVIFLWLLQPVAQQVDEDHTVEIFDISEERVISQLTADALLQRQVADTLRQIDGLFPKVQPIPEDGLLIKISLEPSIYVENEWLVELVDEVILFYSASDEPYLLVFDQENRSYFFTIKTDGIDLLLNILNS